MALAGAFLVLAVVAWFWKSRQYDKQTTLDFDVWVQAYEATSSPFKRSRMAAAFLSQSVDFAWKMSAINSKQRDAVTGVLKGQRATTTVTMWLGSALPAVIRAVGEKDVANTPARAVGMRMLLVWMSPDNGQGNAIPSTTRMGDAARALSIQVTPFRSRQSYSANLHSKFVRGYVFGFFDAVQKTGLNHPGHEAISSAIAGHALLFRDTNIDAAQYVTDSIKLSADTTYQAAYDQGTDECFAYFGNNRQLPFGLTTHFTGAVKSI